MIFIKAKVRCRWVWIYLDKIIKTPNLSICKIGVFIITHWFSILIAERQGTINFHFPYSLSASYQKILLLWHRIIHRVYAATFFLLHSYLLLQIYEKSSINTNSSLDLTNITSIIFFQYWLQFGKRIKELATYNSISYPLLIPQLLQSPAWYM